MGYTHYYYIRCWESAEWQEAWPKLIQDVPIILEAADVLVCGPHTNSPPLVDIDQGIWFNGVADDRHEPFCLNEEESSGFVKTLRKPYDIAVACVLLRAYLLAPSQFQPRSVTVPNGRHELTLFSSDGFWDEPEWIRARHLHQELWPEEPIVCPWGEESRSGQDDHETTKEESSTMALTDSQDPPMTHSHLLLSPQVETSKSTVSDVDFTHVRRWLSNCEDDPEHVECKASPIQWQNLPGIRFKVIDIHRRCIIEAPDDCAYFALTYVWGGVDQLKLNTITASLLMCDGGLDTVWMKLPTTVRDAITVCQQLGEQYLWIDALCMMQDSVREMKLQILRMRQIYSAAKCTIAAVSAETAEIGLLGNLSQSPENCESEDALNTFIESSIWATRAWCYQEKVLSHRLIIFMSNGIYMQCQKGTYDANGTKLAGAKDQNFSKFNAVGSMISVLPGEELESYVSAVEYYSRRKLTKEEDKMNAFQGVFRRYHGKIDGEISAFCYGLPVCAFDQTVCWRTRQHNPDLRNRRFPSWSWLGWNDEVSFDRKILHAARTSQMIYNPDIYNGLELGTEDLLRKPILNLRSDLKFGFPTTTGYNYYNSPDRLILGSTEDLRIALDYSKSDGSNNLYAVFPIRCSQQPPPPAPPKISLAQLISQPLPKMERTDAETEAAPLVPAPKQTAADYDPYDHDRHEECEVRTPFGYIWLDEKWRKKQPEQCIMRFMALTGERDPNRQGKWIITMLMCLQRMEKNGHLWGHERVQVMDCKIEEKRWMKLGTRFVDFKLL